MATATPTIQIYKDRKKEYRWRLLARNGQVVADSGEGYQRSSAARSAAKRMTEIAPAAVILSNGQ